MFPCGLDFTQALLSNFNLSFTLIMLSKLYSFFLFAFLTGTFLRAQDTSLIKLQLDIPVIDFPQNALSPYHLPSMNQSLKWSGSMYDLSFWGIDALGRTIFKPQNHPEKSWQSRAVDVFDYGLGLAFSRYGSELPIPLGVWGHEEFHRSVLGVKDVSSKNGNWFLSRWDGTVYGISDESLNQLKAESLNTLLYSYTAGVQYELALNRQETEDLFYLRKNKCHNALLLYNAWYVYNYFHFSTSPLSDSVKIIAPQYEDSDPTQRDYAGADLTAWAYDMFNPQIPFISRDSFPNGDGVNRRVGFSDLGTEAQEFLLHQKKLSLINFLNPGIIGINRIKLGKQLSFTLFAHYAPTHFGNTIGMTLPVQWKNLNMHLQVQRFKSHDSGGTAVEVGIRDFSLSPSFSLSGKLAAWKQPTDFYGSSRSLGGMINLETNYHLNQKISVYLSVTGKTPGWYLGNPWLNSNFSISSGLKVMLRR